MYTETRSSTAHVIGVIQRKPRDRHKRYYLAMPPKKNNSGKKEFVWSDDEAELLLCVTHEYKTQHLVNGTCWESVKSKYADILELMRKELPSSEEEANRITKTIHTNPRRLPKRYYRQS